MKIPCENCICLARCISSIKYKFMISGSLSRKCSLFKDFINSIYSSDDLLNYRKQFQNIFGVWDNKKQCRIKK